MTPPLRSEALGRSTLVWPALLLLAATLLLFGKTAADMVSVWSRSETFTHAFLVPPIALWLAWRRRHVLAALPPEPTPWLLPAIAATCLMWMVGEVAVVAALSHFALVTLIVLAVPALFGWAIARELMFPLGFLYFAAPFGAFLVPQLMDWTAEFTVLAVSASGVPVYREGLQFVIPSGNWSVVEACSGVRYLIASVMVGTLFAYLNYNSMRRRLVFVAVAIVVPVVANWMRAYMIVMIGHLTNNELAVGVDHLIYGWVFFGIVIGLMFMAGARFADPLPPPPPVPARPAMPAPGALARGWAVAACIIAMLAGSQLLMWRLDQRQPEAASTPQLPATLADGWVADPDAKVDWQPGFRNPSVALERSYRNGSQRVWLWVGIYRQQAAESKLVSSTNTLADPDDKAWRQIAVSRQQIALASGSTEVRSAELRTVGSLTGALPQRLRVWQVYRVGDRYTVSDVEAKVLQTLHRLSGGSDEGAVLIIATPLADAPDQALESFAKANLDRVAAMLKAAPGAR